MFVAAYQFYAIIRLFLGYEWRPFRIDLSIDKDIKKYDKHNMCPDDQNLEIEIEEEKEENI